MIKKLEEIRKKIRNKKKVEEIVVLGGDDDFNRKVLEIKGVDVLLSPEKGHERDSLKQRDSGLNHVLCKLAAKNNIIIGIDFKNLKLKEIELGKWLGRVMQNIRLCRKFRVKMKIFNSKMTKQELRSFLLSLGMSTQQVKETISYSKPIET